MATFNQQKSNMKNLEEKKNHFESIVFVARQDKILIYKTNNL